MYISKSRFINWTRCPMYFPMELKNNPTEKDDIDVECERRVEMLEELGEGMVSSGFSEDDERFEASPRPELQALLPYYNQVEDEALRVANRREALKRYCQQDTWAMVEILRSVREKIK